MLVWVLLSGRGRDLPRRRTERNAGQETTSAERHRRGTSPAGRVRGTTGATQVPLPMVVIGDDWRGPTASQVPPPVVVIGDDWRVLSGMDTGIRMNRPLRPEPACKDAPEKRGPVGPLRGRSRSNSGDGATIARFWRARRRPGWAPDHERTSGCRDSTDEHTFVRGRMIMQIFRDKSFRDRSHCTKP